MTWTRTRTAAIKQLCSVEKRDFTSKEFSTSMAKGSSRWVFWCFGSLILKCIDMLSHVRPNVFHIARKDTSNESTERTFVRYNFDLSWSSPRRIERTTTCYATIPWITETKDQRELTLSLVIWWITPSKSLWKIICVWYLILNCLLRTGQFLCSLDILQMASRERHICWSRISIKRSTETCSEAIISWSFLWPFTDYMAA